ncbi:MAG: peptide deformylase [Allorhizobium sp.]
MKRPIIFYPDPALSTPCAEIIEFGPSLQALADDLFETMLAAPGVGITAAHVGITRRLVVLNLDALGGRRDYINPHVVWASDELMTHAEGSVSMPGVTEDVTRPSAITLRYQDLVGIAQEETLDGFAAVCLQHEIDQLNGIFWLQRLSRLKRDRLIKKWRKATS